MAFFIASCTEMDMVISFRQICGKIENFKKSHDDVFQISNSHTYYPFHYIVPFSFISIRTVIRSTKTLSVLHVELNFTHNSTSIINCVE